MKSFIEQFKEYNQLWLEANTIYERYAESKGLSYTAFLVVLSLCESEGEVTQNTISKLWQLPKQTVNSILSSFKTEGYVTLRRSEQDGRAKVIVLTEEGKNRFSSITSEARALEAKAGELMGPGKLQELNELQRCLNENLSRLMGHS